MTTVTEMQDNHLVKKPVGDQDDGKLSGILKGGKLWKSTDISNQTDLKENPKIVVETDINIDEDGKRSVRFSQEQKETETKDTETETDASEKLEDSSESSLTIKVGNSVIVPNSSKPNSAVHQLFPNRSPDSEDEKKYLVTSESLKLFEEAKQSKLQQYYSCRNKGSYSQKLGFSQDNIGDNDEGAQRKVLKRTIERNTLRRSLLKYPHEVKLKGNQNKIKNESSLIEKIKMLTCNFGDDCDDKQSNNTLPVRTSPSGEESQKPPENKKPDQVSSASKKPTNLFSRPEKLEAANPTVLQTPIPFRHQYPYYQPVYHQASPPDLGNDLNAHLIENKAIVRHDMTPAEARKQFQSSLAPLKCVSGNIKESSVNNGMQLNQPGQRNSVASTSTAAETEYSLDDIEEALNTQTDESKSPPQPDVVADTPSGKSEQDELALFVQQDAGRIERIRKRYSLTPSSVGSDDDEHDGYGFNRRPSVQGIKPKFGSNTEILQQMYSQVEPPSPTCPSRVTWPYYTSTDIRTKTSREVMPMVKEEIPLSYILDPKLNYTNTSVDGRSYQIYSSMGNLHQPQRVGGDGDMQYHPPPSYSESLTRAPPVGMILPYQNADYQFQTTAPTYARRVVPGSVVQTKVSQGHPIRFNRPYVERKPHYSTQSLSSGTTSIIRAGQGIRTPYTTRGPMQVNLLAGRRSEIPQRNSSFFQKNQCLDAGDMQTTYYHVPNKLRGTYYPTSPNPPQNVPIYNGEPLIYSEKPLNIVYNNNYPNNSLRASTPVPSLMSSPTKVKPPERGVPEGAASSSPGFPQDSVYLHSSSSTNIQLPLQDYQAPMHTDVLSSPSSNHLPQTPDSPFFYAMNV